MKCGQHLHGGDAFPYERAVRWLGLAALHKEGGACYQVGAPCRPSAQLIHDAC
ncbi:hypothetical protein LSH36_11g12036 [Paralvinella palmiformis]|uniref:Uncharacterized protein n=1 Tax=Paralvinella palmiformis TaxID=53620 RepID=A0AAD9KCT9_9ANNE|nr:hypothetical protein LSH36_11g12036 [Paralvinella palmiformis]